MHTRCPQCHTVFVVKPAQLTARDGLVRCGRCMVVFNAQEAQVDKSAGNPAVITTARKPSRKTSAKEKPVGNRKPATKDTADPPRRRKAATPLAALPAQPDALVEPLQLTLPGLAPKLRTRLPFWIAGNVLLLTTLLAQAIYFYGSDLVRLSPPLTPALTEVCHLMGCSLAPPQDINLIDLVEAWVAQIGRAHV